MKFANILEAPYNIFKAFQAAIVSGGDRRKLTSQLLFPFQYGKKLLMPQNFAAQLEAYRGWVYICSSKNAISAASVPLRLYVAKKSKNAKLLRPTKPVSKEMKEYLYNKACLHDIMVKSADIEEVVEHPFHILMRNINPFENRFGLWEKTNIHQEITGNAYWWVIKDGSGLPIELWNVPPDFTYVIPHPEEFIAGYLYKKGSQKISFDEDEIIHFKFTNPKNSYYGFAPLAAVTDAYNIYQNMNAYEKALFSNMGRPDGVLQTDQNITEDEIYERIHKEWDDNYGGTNNQGKIAILTSGTKYTPINFSPREMAFLKGRQITKEEICEAYGQSESMRKVSSLAAATVADRAYMRDTIEPRLTRTEEKLNEKFIPMYGDESLFCAFDNPIPENIEEARNERKANLEMGVTDIDHERGVLGMEPYGLEGFTDTPVVASGRKPINQPAPVPAPPPEVEEEEEEKSIKLLAEKMVDKLWTP